MGGKNEQTGGSCGDTLKKLVRGGSDLDDCLVMTGGSSGSSSRKYGSMERGVYTVTKAGAEKGSGKWDQLKSIVRPRRHSKERQDNISDGRKTTNKYGGGGAQVIIDRENQIALAELDSVISAYHKTHTNNNAVGNTNTFKSPKKREKEKSGGTWPKYKGGSLTTWDPTPQPRRDRPPLSMYVAPDYDDKAAGFDVYRSPSKHTENQCNNNNIPRSTSSSPHSQGFSIYKSLDNANGNTQFTNQVVYSMSNSSSIYSVQPGIGGPHGKQPIYSSVGTRSAIEENKKEAERERENRLGSLTPSDTSLDFSVKSGNVGKEELEYYVKKNIVKCPFSDSENNMSPVDMVASTQPLSLPTTYGAYRTCQLRQLPQQLASNSRGSPLYPHTGLYSSPTVGLRSPTFAPYSSYTHYTHQHPHPTISGNPGAVNSSPLYSSPSLFLPPHRDAPSSRLSPPAHDLDSVGGVATMAQQLYEQRLIGSPSPSLRGGNRAPPSAIINQGYYHLSASPSQEFGSNNSNNMNKLAAAAAASSISQSSNSSLTNKHVHQHHYQHHKQRAPMLSYGGGVGGGIIDDTMVHLPLLPSASLLLPAPATSPPPHQDYQRTVTTMPRKRDEEKIRWDYYYRDAYA